MESEVLQFLLHGSYTEAVSYGSVDIHCFESGVPLLFERTVFQCAHIVETVAELDYHYADILRHCKEYLSDILSLLLLLAGGGNLAQLCYSVNEQSNVLSETLLYIVKSGVCILYYTLDGANVEIKDLVGEENCVIFGLTSDEVFNYYAYGGYSPWDVYNADERVKKVMDSLFSGPWVKKSDDFQMIFDEIMRSNDQFFILKDLPAYIKAMEEIDELYQDKAKWAKMMIVNVGQSGYFTSDRTIRDYVRDIWHLDKITK